MVRKLGQPCSMTVNIRWHTSTPIDVCLLQNEEKLNCWHDQKSVETQMNITLAKSLKFKLVSTAGETLASQSVQVNASSHQAYRRKLKSDWSLF